MSTYEPPAKRCTLCGDDWHKEADTEGWMGILCPGDEAPRKVKDAYSNALAKAFATWFKGQLDEIVVLDAEIERKRQANLLRKRSDVTIDELQADVDVRTGNEVGRQKVAEVFQAPEFDVDIPHLTVPAEEKLAVESIKVQDLKHVLTEEEKKAKYDFSLFLDPNPDSLPPELP